MANNRKQQDEIETDAVPYIEGIVERVDLDSEGNIRIGKKSQKPWLPVTIYHRSRGYNSEEQRAFEKRTYYKATFFGEDAIEMLPYLSPGTRVRIFGVPQQDDPYVKDGEERVAKTMVIKPATMDKEFLYTANGFTTADEDPEVDDIAI